MLPRYTTILSFVAVMVCLPIGLSPANAQWSDSARPASRHLVQTSDAVVYTQPPIGSGVLFPSSWWSQGGTVYGQYVWDDFTLSSAQSITEIRWEGGYDPAKAGAGGPVQDFTLAIHASIPGGSEPDVVNPPLATYQTAGKAGETAAGTFDGTTLYDYHYALPAAFPAAAGQKYWVLIAAMQGGEPDWGLAVGSGGDGQHYRKIAAPGSVRYARVSGDAAFSLLGRPLASYNVYLPVVRR